MSSMMPPGAMPPQQKPPSSGTEDILRQGRSPFNPTDIAMEVQDGNLDQKMSVGDFLERIGIDVNGPMSQLQTFMGRGLRNADPTNKMKDIAAAKGQPQNTPTQAGGPREGFDDIIKRFGG
jgi:hypothetical protein